MIAYNKSKPDREKKQTGLSGGNNISSGVMAVIKTFSEVMYLNSLPW